MYTLMLVETLLYSMQTIVLKPLCPKLHVMSLIFSATFEKGQSGWLM